MCKLELRGLICDLNYSRGEASGGATFRSEVKLDPEFKAFDGHFPGKPILPGVVQIEFLREIMEMIVQKRLAIREIKRARMLQMLLPEDRFFVEGEFFTSEDGVLDCKARILKGGKRVSSLQVAFTFERTAQV